MNTFIRKFTIILVAGICSLQAGAQQPAARWIQSTEAMKWAERSVGLSAPGTAADIMIHEDQPMQVVDGFGICFNELGWTALSVLDHTGREEILKNLFDPKDGLNLNICRMPIGANDYARDYYSLNDSVNDFKMKYFSIARDKQMLIPYIKAAMKYQPDLKVWGSPWTPPVWMKTNNHYACRPDAVNDMTQDQAGQEGITQFRMKPAYLKAYALYFTKTIQAYRNEGIRITGVHVQNEMNSCQNFPSCIWTATDLGTFIGNYLGPQMKKTVPDAEIWYGTVERPSIEKVDTILQNPATSKYITGISFQWAGKQAIPGVHQKYPGMKLMQSETECGDGSNDWKAAEYTFSLMKHYFDNGVSVYTFWNSVLDETGKSMWGWKQNSMISVDSEGSTIRYNPEYYLLKHFSSFILPGARMLSTSGRNKQTLVFRNPDGTTVIISGNTENDIRPVVFEMGNQAFSADLQPHSFNTFILGRQSATHSGFYNEDDYLKVIKYDVHCHVNTDRPAFMEAAIKNNFRIVTVNVDAYGENTVDDQLKLAVAQKKLFPDDLLFIATFSMKGYNESGWAQRTVDYLKAAREQGAKGVKVWKNIGMVEKDHNGRFIMIDDPEFDPVFTYLRENKIPVLGHLGEPLNCWLPLEKMTVNNDKSYFKDHPEYHMYMHPDYPTYEALIAARDNLLKKHPDLIFSGAHLASLEWSVDELAKRFEEFPGMTADLAARICHLQFQSQNDWQKVRDFMIKYQDRILYGTDYGDEGEANAVDMEKSLSESWMKDWIYFTTDKAMTSSEVDGEFRGLKLPAEVINKIYYKNAERLYR